MPQVPAATTFSACALRLIHASSTNNKKQQQQQQHQQQPQQQQQQPQQQQQQQQQKKTKTATVMIESNNDRHRLCLQSECSAHSQPPRRWQNRPAIACKAQA